jgi:hypothetical protein
VSPAAVGQMLGKLRRDGVTREEETALTDALKRITDGDDPNVKGDIEKAEPRGVEPKVIIMKRMRLWRQLKLNCLTRLRH